MKPYQYALLFAFGFAGLGAVMWYVVGFVAMLAFMAGAFYVQSGVMVHESLFDSE